MFYVAWTIVLFRLFEKEFTTMQNLADTEKTGILRPWKTGKGFKLKNEVFREVSSNHMKSLDAKILLNLKVVIVQNNTQS